MFSVSELFITSSIHLISKRSANTVLWRLVVLKTPVGLTMRQRDGGRSPTDDEPCENGHGVPSSRRMVAICSVPEDATSRRSLGKTRETARKKCHRE